MTPSSKHLPGIFLVIGWQKQHHDAAAVTLETVLLCSKWEFVKAKLQQ